MQLYNCPLCLESLETGDSVCPRCPNNLVPEPALSDADSVRVQRMVRELAEEWERRAKLNRRIYGGTVNNIWHANDLDALAKELRAVLAKLPNDPLTDARDKAPDERKPL